MPLAAWLAPGRVSAFRFLLACLGIGAVLILPSGCGVGTWGRRRAAAPVPAAGARQDPALSGNGAYLASVIERAGRATVVLQEQPGGRVVRLRHLSGHQPHRSPSLSWNGRYLALVIQQGSRRLAVIEDRATGLLHRLPLPGGQEPDRISLDPDGRRLALEVVAGGRSRVRVLDLSAMLEPDLAGATPAPPGP